MEKHFIDFNDMSLEDWDKLYNLCEHIMSNKDKYKKACEGKILATPFFEPSTRTFFSFQSAMLRLGGGYIEFSDHNNSSVSKGENLKDTIKTIANYVDVIAMRHMSEGAAKAAALYSKVPIINAGDGGHLHPTQTLTDLVTIRRRKGTLSGLSFCFCGDLLNGRTVHSLVRALARFNGNTFCFVSTESLRIPAYVRDMLDKLGYEYREVFSLEEAITSADVLYMTRIQKERFATVDEYESQAHVYTLDTEKLALASKDLIVLHPLPKVDEITPEADEDPRCIYFEQAEYGMYIRMALILSLISANELGTCEDGAEKELSDLRCRNPRCITAAEKYLPRLAKAGGRLCAFCDGALQ